MLSASHEGDRPGVLLVDGATGQRYLFGWDRFPAFWSGYVLENSADRVWLYGLTAGTVLCWVVLAFTWIGRARPGGVARVFGFLRSRRGVAVLVGSFCLGRCPASVPAWAGEPPHATPHPEFWRVPEADGMLMFREPTIDEFRRAWTGYALVPDPPRKPWIASLAVASLAVGAYLGWRTLRWAVPAAYK